jgi:hypothetical protein
MPRRPRKKTQATGKGKGSKTPKIPKKPSSPKTPKKPSSPKSKDIPTVSLENWRGGKKRLVCRIGGKFCTLPEAMKKWKEMGAERPRNPKTKQLPPEQAKSKRLPPKHKEIAKKFLERKGASLPKDSKQPNTPPPVPKDKTPPPVPKDKTPPPIPKDKTPPPIPKDKTPPPIPKDTTPMPKDGKQSSPTSMPGGGKQVGPNAPTLIRKKEEPITSKVKPANIQFKPPSKDPTVVKARRAAKELKQDLGYQLSESEKLDIAEGKAQQLRDKFKEAKESTPPPKTQTPPPNPTPSKAQGKSSGFIEKVGEMIKQRTQPNQPVTDLGKELQQGMNRKQVGKALSGARERTTSIAKKTGKALSETAKAIQDKTGKAINETGKALSETAKAVQNAVKRKAPQRSPIETDWRTNPLTSRGMQPARETVGKKIRKEAGKAVEKAVDIIANPYVQVGLEVYSAPKNIERLKQKGAGPFETYMNIAGRMVGAVAGETFLPKPLRLLPIEEEVGGAIAGTAGKIIDKSGAGKVIIDTTINTAKKLDKLFPAQQININKKRTRPTFKETIGEM